MATQRMIVLTLAGEAAASVATLFNRWRDAPDPEALDQFCARVRENCASLPVVYFTEWLDRWLMGNLVPGPGTVEGRRFQATILALESAIAWANQSGQQWVEQQWLARRLLEVAACCDTVARQSLVVVIREVLGPSTTHEAVQASLNSIPGWLSSFNNPERISCERFIQALRTRLTQRPFTPFRIVMSSGKAYEVRHPKMALLTRTDLLVGVDVADDGIPAAFDICSLLHVTAVEPASAASPQSRT